MKARRALLTHVHYKTAAVFDMAEVTRRAHAAGALTLWDLSHSAGAVAVDLIEWRAARGIVLIGVDSPSLDPEFAKDLKAHAMVARHDMAILEGLVLDEVPEGFYELVGLPPRMANADASPVRAILRGY